MEKFISEIRKGFFSFLFLISPLLFAALATNAQNCPTSGNTNISGYPNTYFPSSTATLPAGSYQMTLGASAYGSDPIAPGDILLIIQMQGAQINNVNDNTYGSGSSANGGTGYTTTNLMAGNMEYLVAVNNVPLTGGTLKIGLPTQKAYQNSAYGTNGQYTYQIVRVPTYYNVTLNSTITAPRWNGTSGGVIVLYALNDIRMNNQTVDASGMGFRGGAGRTGGGGLGTWKNTDYMNPANGGGGANGSKGEGLAGTPKYSNNSYSTIDINPGGEGYPGGSNSMGAPGNAGGGGTDGNPSIANDQNTGGGGGSNGGAGGIGGNSWSTNIASGGRAGGAFAQVSPNRLVMGGGGGAGTTNNGTGTPGSGIASGGAAGGGLVILYALDKITGTGTVLANGGAANSTVQNDGGGGGGAGGSILLFSVNGNLSNITASANGGAGGSNETSGGANHGPGGGGGGGVIYSSATLSAQSAAGGAAGLTNVPAINYGATAGATGRAANNVGASSIATTPSCGVLAVTFLDVKAQASNGAVDLQWSVAYEVSTTGYLVERSTDGANFERIGSVDYREGNATNNSYQYADNGAQTLGGTLYYRIREIGSDGSDIYSRIVSVNLGMATGKVSVYPNPARNIATVTFPVTTATNLSMRLFDLNGRQVWTLQYSAHPGMNSVQIDCIQSLPEGQYFLQWFDKMNSQQVKLLVHH